MKNILNAIRNLPRRGQHNFVKILCLALGLAVSAVFIAEIYFEQSYDTYFPNHDRTYLVNENTVQNGEYKSFQQTPGAIAQGVKDYAPQVEAATRYTKIQMGVQCEVGDKKGLQANVYMADSCLLDVLPREVVTGNSKQALSRPFYCMVSRSFAEKAGGDVVGKHLTGTDFECKDVVIGGVYEDYPYNSSLHDADVIVSMSTMRYASWDGSNNWVGNDRYTSIVRLAKGTDPSSLKPNVKKMMEENIPMNELKKAGMELDFSFTQLSKVYTQNPYIKKMFWILSLVAAMVLLSSVMNYLLIIVGNTVSRSREMAVRKCFGAGRKEICGVVFAEALVHVLLAIVIAFAFDFVCKGAIEQLLSAPLSVLIANKGAVIIALVCMGVVLVGGMVPATIYLKMPVAVAFRGYTTMRHRWKIALLSVQFVASGLFFSLLYVVNAQYNHLISADPGYDYANTAVLTIDGSEGTQRQAIMAEIGRMAEVKAVSSAAELPLNDASGNNVLLPGDDKQLFNIADLYNVTDGYFPLMGVKVMEGRGFAERSDSSAEVMVSRKFVEKLRVSTPFKGSAVGKRVVITEHCDSLRPSFTICGVYEEIRIGSAANPDDRPSVVFYSKTPQNNILIRFHSLTTEGMEKVREKAEADFPDRDVKLRSLQTMLEDQYVTQQSFRTAVLVAGTIILMIAMFGLVGYTIDEVNRRRKEIAVRKVNGATARDILRLFVRSIMRMALPSVLAGCVLAYFVAANWLQSFADKIALTPIPFVVATVMILIVVAAAVVANCLKVAQSNPIRYLKDE